MDNFSGQTTTAVMEILVMLPAGTTEHLQPLDVSTNKTVKYLLEFQQCIRPSHTCKPSRKAGHQGGSLVTSIPCGLFFNSSLKQPYSAFSNIDILRCSGHAIFCYISANKAHSSGV